MLDNQHERNQDRFGDMHMDGKHHPGGSIPDSV